MDRLSTLPSELQIHIFSYLSRQDLKTVRQLCRKCDGNATPALFESVVACTRYHALGTLKKISIHSILPKYVKELWFDGSVYYRIVSDNDAVYSSLEGIHMPDSPGNLFHRRNRWRRYCELYEDQEVIRKSLILLHEVSRALDLLPNVHTVVYSHLPLLVPIESKLMRDILPRGIVSDHYPNRWDECIESCQHGIHHLLGAFHQAQFTGIRHFKVLCPPHPHSTIVRHSASTVFSIYVFNMDPRFIEAALFFFRHLENINMSISLSSPAGVLGNHGGEDRMQLTHLGALLAQASNIRELCLNFYPWARSSTSTYGHLMNPNIPMLQALRVHRITWPYLQSLTLEGIYAEEKQLIDIIEHHTETLRELGFSYCSLFSGSWANVVDLVLLSVGIVKFSIYLVNETTVRDEPFESLSDDAFPDWQYEGKLLLSAEGERYFDEPGHKTVYATRF